MSDQESPVLDPLELFMSAVIENDRTLRIRGYRAAIEATNSPAAAAAWHDWYLASVRARVLCALASMGEVPIAEAAEAVDASVEAGEACAALLALTNAYDELGDPEGVLATVRRVPQTCFRSRLLSCWRFELWDLRVGAAFELGRIEEALHWAERVVGWMEIEELGEDSRDLEGVPPLRTANALLELVASSPPNAERSRALLAEMDQRVDLEDWFADEMTDRIRAAVPERAEQHMPEQDPLTEREAFEAMRLFMERFWSRNGLEPVDVGELLHWTDTGSWEEPLMTNDPAQWHDWATAVRDVRAGKRAKANPAL